MKIIGITGMAGTGKTTFSNILAKKSDAKVIHLDYLMDEVKENRMLKSITAEAKQVEGQEHSYRLMRKGLSDFIYNHKLILKFYLKIRDKIKGKILGEMIEKYGNEVTLIIEGFDLLNFDILEKIDFLILLKTPYYKRIDRLSHRDNIVNKKMVINIDKKLQKNLRSKNKSSIDYTINNNSEIDTLEEHAETILRRLREKTMSSTEKFRKENRILRFRTKTPRGIEKNSGGRKIKNNDKEIYED